MSLDKLTTGRAMLFVRPQGKYGKVEYISYPRDAFVSGL